MAVTTRIRQKGQVTIPAEIRDAVHLDEGTELSVALHGCEIVLSPVDSSHEGNGHDADVFSPELHERLQRALADVEAGNGTFHEDAESFLNSLD